MHTVWVQIHQRWVCTLWVEHAREVQCLVVLATGDSTIGLKVKHLLEALQILDFHLVEAESDWNHHEDALMLGYYLLSNLVEEDIAIVADDHAEIGQRLYLLVEFV